MKGGGGGGVTHNQETYHFICIAKIKKSHTLGLKLRLSVYLSEYPVKG